jgi:hypothetical protein
MFSVCISPLSRFDPACIRHTRFEHIANAERLNTQKIISKDQQVWVDDIGKDPDQCSICGEVFKKEATR